VELLLRSVQLPHPLLVELPHQLSAQLARHQLSAQLAPHQLSALLLLHRHQLLLISLVVLLLLRPQHSAHLH
jgi:hypothetical protein